jgi:hypothetical protein
MHNSPQWIVSFTGFKTSSQEYGKGLRVGSPDRNGKIDIIRRSWHSPGRDGKSANQRIRLQQPAVLGSFKTRKNLS